MGYEGDSLAVFFEKAKVPTKDALKNGAEKAAKRMVEVTKANTPVESFAKQIATFEGGRYTRIEAPGHLRDSIDQSELKVAIDYRGRIVYESGAQTDVFYAPYVEEGTGLWGPKRAKYIIRPKKPGGWLSWITRTGFTRKDGEFVAPGTRVFAKSVEHPGSPGAHMFAIGAAVTEAEFEEIMRPVLDDWKREIEAL